MVLDGGPTTVGIESTVLSLASPRPVVLRPGMLTQAQIEEVIGPVDLTRAAVDGAHPSPGMHRRHYSPRTPLFLVSGGQLPRKGSGAYLWIRTLAGAARVIRMPEQPQAYAAILYDTLHQMDALGFDWIAVEQPPQTAEWDAIRDRLERAAP
ncbi:MAG TPA: Sua5 family C-terminal domain-containing protein, partial [Bryobacteraceae bacterium]|nr:Sua5 family C-terminal domain-containing protein [Bryobacteraceae bacterium]